MLHFCTMATLQQAQVCLLTVHEKQSRVHVCSSNSSEWACLMEVVRRAAGVCLGEGDGSWGGIEG